MKVLLETQPLAGDDKYMPKLVIVALVLEILGITTSATGIGIELKGGASLGHLLITIGACLVAIGGLTWARVLRSLNHRS
jgi:hypothetical protein